MKKGITLVLVILLALTTSVYAQGARNASGVSVGQASRSNFSSIGLMGVDIAGAPGYLAMTGTQPTVATEYYLWFKGDGDLCTASASTVRANLTNDTLEEDWTGVPCTVIGGQS